MSDDSTLGQSQSLSQSVPLWTSIATQQSDSPFFSCPTLSQSKEDKRVVDGETLESVGRVPGRPKLGQSGVFGDIRELLSDTTVVSVVKTDWDKTGTTGTDSETTCHTAVPIQPRACGAPRCRVCRALGLLPPDRRRRLSASRHHPINTRRGRDRLEMVYVALRAAGGPVVLADVARAVGLKSSGLVSLYVRRLSEDGRARRVRARWQGRGGYRWEAV